MVGAEQIQFGLVIACIAIVLSLLNVVFGAFRFRRPRISNVEPVTPTSPPPAGVDELPLPVAGTDGQREDAGDFEDCGDVVIKGLEALRHLGEKECGLVSIFGPLRQGKSFLMNYLRRCSIFTVQDDVLGVGTQGISVCHPLTVEELCLSTVAKETAGTGSKDNVGSTIAFADTEGIGGYGGVERDTRLVASLLPFSRVVIFNWMGGFQVDTILHQLGLFTSRVMPLLPAGSQTRQCLGFLHIVLRDIDMSSIDEVRVNELLLLPEPEPLPGSERRNNAAVERNDVRAMLKQTFRGISVWTIPHPFTRDGTVQISDAFTRKVDRLRSTISGQVARTSQTSVLGMEAVTGTAISNKLPSLLDSTGPSADLPLLPSSPCSSFQRATVKEAITLYQEHLRTFASELKQHYPMAEGDLNQSFTSQGRHLTEILNQAIASVANGALIQSAATEANELWSFYLHQAIYDNRLAKKEALHRALLSSKDEVVRRLSKEFRVDSNHARMTTKVPAEAEKPETTQWSWLDEQEMRDASGEEIAFTRMFRAEFDTAIKHNVEELRRQFEREAVAEHRRANRQRDWDREREQMQQSKQWQKQRTLSEEKYELRRQRQDLEEKNMRLTTETVALRAETEDVKHDNSNLVNLSVALQAQANEMRRMVQVTDEQKHQIAAERAQLEEQLEMEVIEKTSVENLAQSLEVHLVKSEQARIEDLDVYRRSQEQIHREKRDLKDKLNESLEDLELKVTEAKRQEQEAAEVQKQLQARLDLESERRRSERLSYHKKARDMTNEREAMERDREEERRRTVAEKEQLTRKQDRLVGDVAIQRAANCELVRVTDEMKKENLELEEKLGGHMADWRWQNDSYQWQSYDDRTVELLEKAYKQQQAKVSFYLGHWLYEIDLTRLENMTQTNLETHKVRKVKREKLTFEGYPKSWEDQTKEVHRVSLTPDGEEFKKVEQVFQQSMSRVTFKIIEVQRIQRRFLWHEYQLAKQRMHRKNKGFVNERELFHGTRANKPEVIYNSEKGFDNRFANEGLWGTGTYFAEKASYSDRYAHNVRRSDGRKKQMFLAIVLAGISQDDAPQDSSRRIPDQRPSTGIQGTAEGDVQYRYDSLNGVTQGSRVHILFDNGHAYPNYLITYLEK